ncbi:MAG: hypothetical protein AAFX58_11190 [Pseudomonadota bacterium]
MSTTNFSDRAHSVAELVFQGATAMNPQDSLDDAMLAALAGWQQRGDVSQPAVERLHQPDCLCFHISYRGESDQHWPDEDSTLLSEALVRDFLYEDGICNVATGDVLLYAVNFQIMAMSDTEYLLVCPYPTSEGNIGGLIVVCVNKRLKAPDGQ